MGDRCVYCGKVFDKRSREHVIQNALGGLYESEDICCPACNTFVSKEIDAPFTRTFNAIVSKIEKFVKTNNRKSTPTYSGIARYEGTDYHVLMKAGKIISCPELSEKLKCDVKKLNWQIIGYDFPIENRSFKNGLSKIAFNFALDKGIDKAELLKRVNVKSDADNRLLALNFNYQLVPFVPLNGLDYHIELETDLELYHNLILFNQGNCLWCYIDLFNTFQYYVLLSDEWDSEVCVHETYIQLLQKLDRSIPDYYFRKPKQILTTAMFYNIEPTLDVPEFKKRIEEAIKKESLKKNMNDLIAPKINSGYLKAELLTILTAENLKDYLEPLTLYLNEDDSLNEKYFRKVTLIGRREIASYPFLIENMMKERRIDVQKYTMAKFGRLRRFLLKIDKADEVM